MVEHRPPGFPAASLKLRRAVDGDLDFVTRLSGTAFNVFGEYDTFLPRYLEHPDILTTLCTADGNPVGFIMLALVLSESPVPWSPAPDDGGVERGDVWVDAEIVAIAVTPAGQGRGVGSRLMQHALQFARTTGRASGARSLQLNVADTNHRAMAFFRQNGFVVVNEHDGVYPRGQRSIRMARPL